MEEDSYMIEAWVVERIEAWVVGRIVAWVPLEVVGMVASWVQRKLALSASCPLVELGEEKDMCD